MAPFSPEGGGGLGTFGDPQGEKAPKKMGLYDQPRFREDAPPGGLITRVLGVSEMKLPQFWSAPFAKELEVTRGRCPWTICSGAASGAPAGALPPAPAALRWLESSQDNDISEAPPGGFRTLVVGTEVRTLPWFWLLPQA